MANTETNKGLELYGNYGLEAIVNRYKTIASDLKRIDEESSKILDIRLFNDNMEIIFFKEILDLNYQPQFFINFQNEFSNKYQKELINLIGLEGVSIILDDEEEFYNFIIYFEGKPLFIIFPYTKYVKIIPDDALEEIQMKKQQAEANLEELRKTINFLKQCLDNPTLYSLDSNKSFAKVILNKKGVKAEIQAELNSKLEEADQLRSIIYDIEDYFKENQYNDLKEASVKENIESRLKTHNFTIETTSHEDIEEEVLEEDNIENYESLLKNNDSIFDDYNEI